MRDERLNGFGAPRWMDIGDYEYNPKDGLYYFESYGFGYREDDVRELMVEVWHEQRQRRLAER